MQEQRQLILFQNYCKWLTDYHTILILLWFNGPIMHELIVLFGPPGCGKNYCAALFTNFGFMVYDADIDFTKEQLLSLKENKPFTISMREKWYKKVNKKISQLLKVHQKVVVTNTLINDRFRREFLDLFPFATLVLVTVSREIRVSRLHERSVHVVPYSVAVAVGDFFESPSMPVLTLENSGTSNMLLKQIPALIKRSRTNVEKFHLQNKTSD